MLAVPAAAAALLHPAAFGQNQCRFADDIGNRLEPLRMQARGIDGPLIRPVELGGHAQARPLVGRRGDRAVAGAGAELEREEDRVLPLLEVVVLLLRKIGRDPQQDGQDASPGPGRS